MSSGNSSQLKYYYDLLSQPSRALYIILKESETPFEACTLNLLEGESSSDDYAEKVNRFRKVPAIIDGNFKLAESVAILRYFAHQNYIANRFYPSDDMKQRARIDEFLSWQHLGIRRTCSLYFRFVWVQKMFTGQTASAGKVARFLAEMEDDLSQLETIWLKDTLYIAGEQLTAADIFGACEVEQIRMTGYKIANKFPNIAAWIERIRSELNPHFDIAHKKVYFNEQEFVKNL